MPRRTAKKTDEIASFHLSTPQSWSDAETFHAPPKSDE
jgi:hypothetical protein